MFQSDLAIGAAGSTSWERCCLGIPSLIVVLAANQREIATALHDVGAARTISSCSLHEEISLEINAIMNAISRLGEFSKAASKITDGQGAKRVVSSLQRINLR